MIGEGREVVGSSEGKGWEGLVGWGNGGVGGGEVVLNVGVRRVGNEEGDEGRVMGDEGSGWSRGGRGVVGVGEV